MAKAAEIVTERWTILVIRELLCGSHRFSEIQRGVPLMSPSLLAQRLRMLERAGVVERRSGGRSPEYHLTTAGEELGPVVMLLGAWGQRWTAAAIDAGDLDAGLLMWDVRRRLHADRLPRRRTVVRFHFLDGTRGKRDWWLVVDRGEADLCLTDPGYDVDLTVTSDVLSLTLVWMGRLGVTDAVQGGRITLDGRRDLARAFPGWLQLSAFAGAAPLPAAARP
ncbi:MAG TPA: helix-turn-helix domain-containing protein [Dehalococcoidia bacterium]